MKDIDVFLVYLQLPCLMAVGCVNSCYEDEREQLLITHMQCQGGLWLVYDRYIDKRVNTNTRKTCLSIEPLI